MLLFLGAFSDAQQFLREYSSGCCAISHGASASEFRFKPIGNRG
jgi:hypothetical protein